MKNWQKQIPVYALLLFFVVVALFPFYWMTITSFKTFQEMYGLTTTFWPKTFTLEHYRVLLGDSQLLKTYQNSLVVTLAAVAIGLAISSIAAYALVRLDFRGKTIIGSLVLFVYLITPAILVIPLYQLLVNLRLDNTLWALIVSFPTRTVPFCTWLLMGYFKNIPKEIEESAMIDGCGRLKAFFKIVIPVCTPAFAAAAIFIFIMSWQMFLYPLVFVTTESKMLLPVYIKSLILGDVMKWGQLMAAAVIVTAPVIVLFVFVQRWIVGGLASGAVKG